MNLDPRHLTQAGRLVGIEIRFLDHAILERDPVAQHGRERESDRALESLKQSLIAAEDDDGTFEFEDNNGVMNIHTCVINGITYRKSR